MVKFEVGIRESTLRLPVIREDREPPLSPEEKALRPKTRGDCKDGLRPCPYVSCSHHLYLEVSQHTGHIKYNFPTLDLEEMSDTCSLDVADRGDHTLEEIAQSLGLTRSRAGQIEELALYKLYLQAIKTGQ